MSDALTFGALRQANAARQAEWCPDQVPDLSFRGNELAGEVGEACNIIKKLERERHGWRGSRATVADLAKELADVVITADLAAMKAGVDLGAAVAAKFDATSEKNGLATRISTRGHSVDVEVIQASDVRNAMDGGAGFWRSCSGCHELNDGAPTGRRSHVLRCHLGLGCSECGGIGAVWDTTDYKAFGDAIAAGGGAADKRLIPPGKLTVHDFDGDRAAFDAHVLAVAPTSPVSEAAAIKRAVIDFLELYDAIGRAHANGWAVGSEVYARCDAFRLKMQKLAIAPPPEGVSAAPEGVNAVEVVREAKAHVVAAFNATRDGLTRTTLNHLAHKLAETERAALKAAGIPDLSKEGDES